MVNSLLLVVLFALSATAWPFAPQVGEKIQAQEMTIETLEAQLVSLMRASIETPKPNASYFRRIPGGGEPFAGSYDWHSSVIAHWALLIHARVAKDDELEAWLLERLTLDALNGHARIMERRGGVDGGALKRTLIAFPYDEGWFHLMLAELSKRPSLEGIVALRQQSENRLLDTLEKSPFPENVSYTPGKDSEDVFCGFYKSSLFLYLQLRWAGSSSKGNAERLAAWRKTQLDPNRSTIAAIEEVSDYDFLWLPAILALANQVDERKDSEAYVAPSFEQGWPERVTLMNVHILGKELTRVWPFAASATLDEADGTYVKRLSSFLEREDLWAENFLCCSHWIPQFLFIGEWLRKGRP